MFTKIQQGGTSYDLTVPSDYMIEKMKKANLLLPLDKSKLRGMQNMDPRLIDKDFDRNNKYSIPYFWGTLGIIYNDKFVKTSEVQHWDQLWNPNSKDSIMLIDSARDVFAPASFSWASRLMKPTRKP